jgi:hypothetical protein
VSNSLNLIAVGDLSFNGGYRRALAERGMMFPFLQVAPLWKYADLRFGNLESPITDKPRVAAAKFTLRGAPQAVEALNAAGIDGVSLANNHMMDFGPDGLLDTCRHLDAAGIPHVGAGRNLEEATTPLIISRNGWRLGMLAYCDVAQISSLYASNRSAGVAPLDFDRCLESIRRLRTEVDWLVVHLHWGEEMSRLPSPGQRDDAARLVDAGADVILGHHPHVMQPIEQIHNSLVAYSLGDFLFSNTFWHGTGGSGKQFLAHYDIHPLSRQTGWLDVELHSSGPPRARLETARLERSLQVTPTRSGKFELLQHWFRQLLDEGRLDAAFEKELAEAHARERWRLSGRRWLTRLRIKLLQYGCFPGVHIEPDEPK